MIEQETNGDGLHCVYGKCQGLPHNPMPCHPGCRFQMSAVSDLEMLRRTINLPAPSADLVAYVTQIEAPLQITSEAPEDRAYRDGYMQACREYEAHLCATGRLSPESRGWLFARQKEIERRVKQ
jgi:hypothetical protein